MQFSEALKELREKNKKRNFDQTLDLIINLKEFDLSRESLKLYIDLPYLATKKRICGFLENPSRVIDFTITKNDLDRISSADMKKLVKSYDFFIANAKLMPQIATKFGKILGITGKMPDPKAGSILMQESEAAISALVEKLSKTVKIHAKEKSLKIAIGKENMPNSELVENASAVFKNIVAALPKKELNVKSVLLKFTMSPAIKLKQK